MSGLSPRVRGNRVIGHLSFSCGGSIPACAGEPSPRISRWPPMRVYPRVCGGTLPHGPVAISGTGLSPRVRGNPLTATTGPSAWGSIPACAGEPRQRRGAKRRCRVYPRVCGGTRDRVGSGVKGAGLSPRVRGNPRRSGHAPARPGSIPACAGEPTRDDTADVRKWVYPRVCGGTAIEPLTMLSDTGLSPRVRGSPGGCDFHGRTPGSIPACAGEPASWQWCAR